MVKRRACPVDDGRLCTVSFAGESVYIVANPPPGAVGDDEILSLLVFINRSGWSPNFVQDRLEIKNESWAIVVDKRAHKNGDHIEMVV